MASGLLLIDKPEGITSFDCIRRLRRATGLKKFGHAGTLDPMATGLMLILAGSSTKRASELSGLDKTYSAELTLGADSSTGDREGELSARSARRPSLAEIQEAASQLTGEIQQVPPAYSAIKVAGVRSYKLAREGRSITHEARPVTVHRFQITEYSYPLLAFEAEVSSGTYIRSLAQDLGAILETGAYLSRLQRTAIGSYSVESAAPIGAINDRNLNDFLMPF